MIESEIKLINELKHQIRQMKARRWKRRLERIVMHFKTLLPGMIGLTIGLSLGALFLNTWDDLFDKIIMVSGGYIMGYINFKKQNA